MAPASILVMRHAEKPRSPIDPHLSEAGRRRAALLADWLPETFGRPDILFAAADKLLSRRPRETLEPLASATGAPLHHDVSDKRSEAFAAELLSDRRYDQALVVVSWRHKALPGLARALGAKTSECPDPWPGELYDLVLRFDYAE
ncbi:MAG TPA: histidine phosphatase family protein, partial [Beijerinckiaceae bacterium]|nr:histidine phosphatase family protein [Beijerinckiaceae bacterium]